MRPVRLSVMIALLLAPPACSPEIAIPAPAELKAELVSGSSGAVLQLGWQLVIRVDGYLVHYSDNGKAGPPYAGQQLALVRWPQGCGDLDGGAAPAADAMSTIAADLTLPDIGTADQALPDASPADQGAADLSPDGRADAGQLPYTSPSPIRIPVAWCLDQEDTYSDAGKVPVQSPGARPRVRLRGLRPGKTYHFAVQAFRRGTASAMSAPVSYTLKAR